MSPARLREPLVPLYKAIPTSLVLSLLLTEPLPAQERQNAQGTGATQEPTCPPATDAPRVTDAYRVPAGLRLKETPSAGDRVLKLRDDLAVHVENLRTLLEQQRCARAAGRPHTIVLFLDQQPLPDLTPYPPTDPDSGVLRFRLSRSEASRETWTRLLGKPGWSARPTSVSVGLGDGFAIPSEATIQLAVLPHGWFTFWGVLFLLFLLLFLGLAVKSGLLRDDTPEPTGRHHRPYSLARTQGAWWFFLILASYLFIGMVTGDFSTSITGTVLVLLGVSAGTAIGSALIDSKKATPEDEARQAAAIAELEAKLAQIDAELTGIASPPQPLDAARKATLMSERIALASRTRKLLNQSESFLLDILSDADGVNFHRFQMVVWTLVLSIVFGVEVYREVGMPQFSETLLGLMGISAGTYLGLKVPEATVPKTM